MIPESVFSLLFFVALIAPGLAYELLWEKRHPALEQSTFREASRTVLMSLVFSGISLGVLSLLRLRFDNFLVNTGEFIRTGEAYVLRNYGLIGWTLGLQVALALALVLLAHFVPVWLAKLPFRYTKWMPNWLCSRWRGEMTSEGIWFDVLRRHVPTGKAPWVSLRLTDGSQIRGYVSHYTPSSKPEGREICLEKPAEAGDMRIVDTKMSPRAQHLGRQWRYIVVRGDEITYMRVTYLDR